VFPAPEFRYEVVCSRPYLADSRAISALVARRADTATPVVAPLRRWRTGWSDVPHTTPSTRWPRPPSVAGGSVGSVGIEVLQVEMGSCDSALFCRFGYLNGRGWGWHFFYSVVVHNGIGFWGVEFVHLVMPNFWSSNFETLIVDMVR